MSPVVPIPPQSLEVMVERSKQTSGRMDGLGYQDLLSKCIQNGRPGGGYSKSSSTLQGKGEPAAGTGQLLENSTSGSRGDTSGAAEGPFAESDSGHRVVIGMDGTVVDKRRSPFVSTPKSVGTGHMPGRALRSEDLKIDGFPRSLLKSRGMGTKARTHLESPPLTFSFRSLLEGAISASGVKPPSSVQRIVEAAMQGALQVEPQKDSLTGEEHPVSDERRLVGERYDGVVSGRSTLQSRREEKVLSGEGMAESWKGEGNFALRAHDSGSLNGDTVGDSGPHVSYSSFLQAQLGDDVDEVRTHTPQRAAGASLVDVEAHSPPVNLQLQSVEVRGGFLALLSQTTPSLPTVARRASFPPADSVSIGEKIFAFQVSDKSSHALAIDDLRSADKVSERDVSESLRASVVPASPVLTRAEQDVSRTEPVVERERSLLPNSTFTNEVIQDAQPPEEDDGALAADESQSSDILSEKVAIDSSETATVPASPLPRETEEDVSRAEVVVDRGSFVAATAVCIDEEVSDVQLFEELSRALAIDESRFAGNVSNRNAIDSSEAAAVPGSAVPTRTEEDGVEAVVVVDRSIIMVVDSVSTDERIPEVQLSEKSIGKFGEDESRSADDVSKGDVIHSSEAAAVPESLVFTRIEEADLPAGLDRASCLVAASRAGDKNVSGVQLPEILSRDLTLDESRTAEVVSERDVLDMSEAAAVPVSAVPVRTEEDISRLEVVAGSIGNGEKTSDLLVSEETSQALALHGSRSAGNVFIESSEGAGDSASPVPRIAGEDVPPSKAVVEKEVGHCRDAVVDTEQDKIPLRSFNSCDGQVPEERIQSPSQGLKTVNDRLQGEAHLVNAGSTLDPAYQASRKEMEDANGDSVGVPEFNVCDAQIKCGVGRVSETDKAGSSDAARVSLSMERDPSLQKDLVDEPADTSCDGILRSEEVRDTETVVECSRQADLKQTENGTALSVEEQKDEMCDAHMSFPTENVPLRSNANFDLAEVVVEKESDISKGELVHSVHTEEVKDDLNASAPVEKSSSTSVPLLDAGAVLGSPWQAGTKHSEDINNVVGRDEEDNSCHIQVLEDLMGQDAAATEEHLMGGDYGSDPQRSCVGSVEITSSTVSPHVNGNLVDAGCIHTDERDQMVSMTEEKVEQDHMLGAPEGLSENAEGSEVEQYRAHALADEALEMQIAVSQFSESRAVNMGLVVHETGHESEKFPSSDLALVEPGIRNGVERVPEGHVGEIVNDAIDSSNSGDPADQVLSADPDAISEGLRQVFLRDSDATVSDSLESAQGTGADLVAGKEVQSPLVTKSKDRHTRHLDDLEDSHIRHLEDLEDPRTRHLDDLDETEEQPYASSLNGAVHAQWAGAEVPPYKKKGRPRVYNHEKAVRGTGGLHFHPSGSKRKRQLQDAGNRCRRNRHIYPDQPVPVHIEGRDEGFEEADGGSFSRWLAHQDEPNAAPSSASGKRVRKHGQELVKSIIAIPSFRVVSDYEERQQEVEKRRKLGMQQQPVSSSRQAFVSSSTVQPSDYDMDDEDERWLHAWNMRLARDGLKQPISEDKFEEMIEYFERRSAEMDVSAAGDFPGFPHYQKTAAQPVRGGSLPRTSPLGLGLLSTKPTTSGTPVPGNPPTLHPPAVRSGRPPWAGGLRDVMSSERQAMVSSSIRVDSIGRNSASPASTVRYHTLTSENERNISNSVVDTVCERPSVASLRKSFEPPALEKPSDDCCICNGGEDDENNPVYTCKRCLIHVHQSCYGIREKFRDDEDRVIAPSNWCCRKCEAVAVGKAQPSVSCVLCRKRGGALKPTVVAQKWAHVACALYTNETFFVDPDAMEPIDGIAAVAARAQERQERCGLCGVKRGICSLCAVKDCRAPFHISCGVSQGASFELRQSKQKVVGVRSFCPRHARTTTLDSAPSSGLKERHMVSSSSTSGATASSTASGSISTASSMDDREEGSSRRSISHPDGSFAEAAAQAEDVGTHVDNVTIVNGNGVEDAGRGRPKGIRFTLKRRWDESGSQVREDGVLFDRQKKCSSGIGVSGDKMEAPGCKSTWHVVEPGQKPKKIKFRFGRLTQNPDSESSPTLVQQERIGSEDPQAEKMEAMPAVAEMCGDAAVNERDAECVKGLSEERFAKEVKELMILEEAMKSGVAPGHIMREAFVYWRAKRAESKGSLLCELHHEQWLRSQGIFNKDASGEERVATGKMGSPLRIPLAQQPSPMSTEKTLEMATEIRMQLERVRSMAQMVVQREKLKYKQQLVLGTIASAEVNRAEGVSEERHCVWCPSTKTLLKCGTCPRSFCFNCFKHRKGFGVKGWMAAMKQTMYICKYCRELSNEVANVSNNLDPASKKIVEGGAVSTQVNTTEPAVGVVSSTRVITSEAVVGMVNTSVTLSEHVGGGRGKGMGKGRGKGRGWQSPGSGSLRIVEAGRVMALTSKGVDVTEGREKGLRIGRGNGTSWTVSDNAGPGSPRPGSENRARDQSKPSQLEDGLNKFLSSTQGQMEHSSFETTLRRLKILRRTNTDAHQAAMTNSAEIPSRDMAEGHRIDGMEGVTPSTTIVDNVCVPASPGSGPALLVYKKKRRLILGASSESPPSAYDLGDHPSDPPCSPTGIENGTSDRITSPRQLANGDALQSIRDSRFWSGK